MKISVIIPFWPLLPEVHYEELRRCVASMAGADEILIAVNEGMGFARASNLGLRAASGDFLVISNSDLWLTAGNIRDLPKPGVVTTAEINGQESQFWGALFCLPRETYEAIGGFDEQFEMGNYEDEDLKRRLLDAGIPMECVPGVKAHHVAGSCNRHIPNIMNYVQANRERFEAKWGQQPVS